MHHVWSLVTHRAWVAWYVSYFCARLLWRTLVHDLSKLRPDEAAGIVRVIHRLKGLTFGSEEYRSSLRDMKPSIALHYARNRHHPEHHVDGVKSMTLVDLVEMWCDWRAAARRQAGGSIIKSIVVQRDRYNLSDELTCIFENESGE